MRVLIFILFPFFAISQIDDSVFIDLYELQEYETYKVCYKSNKKSYLITGLVVFVEGMLNGVGQDMQYHYAEFKRTFPNANDQFWNPNISWKNKYMDVDGGDYREKFSLSKTALVWTTDGKHLIDTAQRGLVTTALILSYNKRKNWKHYLLDAAALTLIRSAGFHLTYSIIIK